MKKIISIFLAVLVSFSVFAKSLNIPKNKDFFAEDTAAIYYDDEFENLYSVLSVSWAKNANFLKLAKKSLSKNIEVVIQVAFATEDELDDYVARITDFYDFNEMPALFTEFKDLMNDLEISPISITDDNDKIVKIMYSCSFSASD